MFHVKHSLDDTIAAIITPQGVGGVGVVRISGDLAVGILGKIIKDFPAKTEPLRMYHSWLFFGDRAIDEVLYCYFKAPSSYTGEDVAEISCHGGPLVLREALEQILSCGARLAERGEFTKRAFLNGRIDLTRAEAVLDLISARTRRGIEAAAAQLGGRLSDQVRDLRGRLIGILSEIEAGIDFPDDVDGSEQPGLISRLVEILSAIDELLQTADAGKLIREGARMAIVGKPNVGKSSLLNVLLGEDRAIVTEFPGTTRDTIEEVININGFPVVVVDTAGIRHPRDMAEVFGVERARKEAEASDVVMVVLDCSSKLTAEDEMVLNETRHARRLLVLNKVDLGNALNLNGFGGSNPQFKVSAVTGQGISELRTGIFDLVVGGGEIKGADGAYINSRHREGMMRARESVLKATDSCQQGLPCDFTAIDLKGAIVALGEVSGESVSEEVVNSIFERFCVGK